MTKNNDPCDSPFARDVIEGLSRPQKRISSRWLYDTRGSELFEQITDLDEYYPTRTETAIFEDEANAIAHSLGRGAVLVEYGAGALVKTRILLDALDAPGGYVPIDISGPFLRKAAEDLSSDYPDLTVSPVVADFTKPVDLSAAPGDADARVGFFPGSTIGNLEDDQITSFFRAARASLGASARFILGADLKKDPAILVPAYDDAQGVTAEFNKNLLVRMNRELGADFDLGAFDHEARWNDSASQIEMHLVANRSAVVSMCGASFNFETGETIHTEISRKFDLHSLDQLLRAGGWTRQQTWTDPNSYFAVMLLGPNSPDRLN
ncbi:MAG: L-histidine N(alpha)-methyltransferase [Pseudomonadota bacterium]